MKPAAAAAPLLSLALFFIKQGEIRQDVAEQKLVKQAFAKTHYGATTASNMARLWKDTDRLIAAGLITRSQISERRWGARQSKRNFIYAPAPGANTISGIAQAFNRLASQKQTSKKGPNHHEQN